MPIDRTGKTVRLGYLDQWRQALKTYSPTIYAALSFILPLVAVPIAVEAGKKGYEYAKKKIVEKKRR